MSEVVTIIANLSAGIFIIVGIVVLYHRLTREEKMCGSPTVGIAVPVGLGSHTNSSTYQQAVAATLAQNSAAMMHQMMQQRTVLQRNHQFGGNGNGHFVTMHTGHPITINPTTGGPIWQSAGSIQQPSSRDLLQASDLMDEFEKFVKGAGIDDIRRLPVHAFSLWMVYTATFREQGADDAETKDLLGRLTALLTEHKNSVTVNS